MISPKHQHRQKIGHQQNNIHKTTKAQSTNLDPVLDPDLDLILEPEQGHAHDQVANTAVRVETQAPKNRKVLIRVIEKTTTFQLRFSRQ